MMQPFTGNGTIAEWPRDIPASHRWCRSDSKWDYSTVWTIPPGTCFDDLLLRLPRHVLVIAVRQGAIRLFHGAREAFLVAGQGALVSLDEVSIEIPENRKIEQVFEIHLVFRKSFPDAASKLPNMDKFLEINGPEIPGLFPIRDARPLLFTIVSAGFCPKPLFDTIVPHKSTADLLRSVQLCGLKPLVRWVASVCGPLSSPV